MRVLLVEDDERVSRFIARGLTEDGHSVTVRSDGLDAEDQVLYESYDVVVLDLMLPGQSGMELLRHVRAAGSAVPVLILTARDALDDKIRGLEGGADDYLVKPFAFEELLARLHVLERRARGASPGPLVCGCLALDAVRHVALCNGHDLALTHTEFRLLEYLCRHAGRTLSRAQIEQSVWGDEHDRESNVVAVYINYLRRKLEQAGASGLIETVRGAGYRLREGQA
jgi:DNA-binding response OmpR family regulator